MLRMTFELHREEVKGDWRKLHNKELHGLLSSPSTSILPDDEINVKIFL
jgi:hypothetical protein